MAQIPQPEPVGEDPLGINFTGSEGEQGQNPQSQPSTEQGESSSPTKITRSSAGETSEPITVEANTPLDTLIWNDPKLIGNFQFHQAIAQRVLAEINALRGDEQAIDSEIAKLPSIDDQNLVLAFEPGKRSHAEEKVDHCISMARYIPVQFREWYILAAQFDIVTDCIVHNGQLLLIQQGMTVDPEDQMYEHPLIELQKLEALASKRQRMLNRRQEGEELIRTPAIWESLVAQATKLFEKKDSIPEKLIEPIITAIAIGAVTSMIVTPLVIANAALWIEDTGDQELLLEHLRRIFVPHLLQANQPEGLITKLAQPIYQALLRQVQGQELSLTANGAKTVVFGDSIATRDLLNSHAMAFGTNAKVIYTVNNYQGRDRPGSDTEWKTLVRHCPGCGIRMSSR